MQVQACLIMQVEGKSQELLKIPAQKKLFHFPLGPLSALVFFPGAVDWISSGRQPCFKDSRESGQGHAEKPAAAWAARGAWVWQRQAGCWVCNQAGVKKGQEESRCSRCLSVSNHADKNRTTPSAQQKISLSIYPYNITIQASGHLLSLSKQKSPLKTLVMQVMAWNHPFSRKMVILLLESMEDWLGIQSYYVPLIQSPLVTWEPLTDQSIRVFFRCRYVSHWCYAWIFLWVLLAY